MLRRSRIIAVGVAVAVLLTIGVSTASASRLSVSNRAYRIVWAELSFIAGKSVLTRCPVTLEGSFHAATISKVNRALIGHISRAVNGSNCTGTDITILKATLPWQVQYCGFSGNLPTIASICLRYIGMSFRLFGGVPCLARTTEVEPARGEAIINPSGQVTGFSADEAASIALENFLCGFAGTVSLSGTGTVTLLGSSNAIFVRLI